MSPRRGSRRFPISTTGVTALVLALLALALYAATFQPWWYGDAPQMIDELTAASIEGYVPQWIHPLYLPAAWLLVRVLGEDELLLALKVLSVVPAAATIAITYVVLVRLRASRPLAIASAAFLAVTPSFWFFATTVEVHALQAAVVAGSVAVLLFAPWSRRYPLAVSLSALAFGLCFLAHRSDVLLAGAWIVLLVYLHRRDGVPASFPRVAGAIAAHAAALVLAMLASAAYFDGGDALGITSSLEFVLRMRRGFDHRLVTEGLVAAWALAVPTTALGVFLLHRTFRRVVLAALIPVAAFHFLVFGDPNMGGYFLGVACFATIATARVLASLPTVGALLLILAQAAFGYVQVRSPDADVLAAARRARAEAAGALLPEGGTVLSADPTHQTISGAFPGLLEDNLIADVVVASEAGATPSAFAQFLRSKIEERRSHGPVALDLSFRAYAAGAPHLAAYMEALVSEVQALGGTPVARGPITLLVLDRPSPADLDRSTSPAVRNDPNRR